MLLGFLLCRSPDQLSDHLQVGLGVGEEPAAGCWPHLSLAVLLGPPSLGSCCSVPGCAGSDRSRENTHVLWGPTSLTHLRVPTPDMGWRIAGGRC